VAVPPSAVRGGLLRFLDAINPADGSPMRVLLPADPDDMRAWYQSWKCVVADGWRMLGGYAQRVHGLAPEAICAALGYRKDTPKTTWDTHGPLAVTMALANAFDLVGVLDPKAGFYFVRRSAVDGQERISG
jgi:hypothetical protein